MLMLVCVSLTDVDLPTTSAACRAADADSVFLRRHSSNPIRQSAAIVAF